MVSIGLSPRTENNSLLAFRNSRYVSDIAPDCKEQIENQYPGRFFFTPKKMGAQTAEANINAKLWFTLSEFYIFNRLNKWIFVIYCDYKRCCINSLVIIYYSYSNFILTIIIWIFMPSLRRSPQRCFAGVAWTICS